MSQSGLINANFQLTCGCGEVASVSFIGLRADSEVPCPTCGDDLPLDEFDFDAIFDQFETAVKGLFKQAGLAEPDDQVIEFIQKYNRAPTPDDLRKPNGYAVGLVAEEHYQTAIMACSVGERVTFFREIGNPHDPQAIVAVDARDQVIGYIARKNFVYRVVNDQEQGCGAVIFAFRDERGCRDVVLDVQIDNTPIGARAYAR